MRPTLLLFILLILTAVIKAQNLPVLLKDITPGDDNTDITELTVVGDIVFFLAPDGTNGFQLWRTDGTTTGTFVVKVINSGPSGMYTYINSLTNVNGILFFLADDGIHGNELWKSDGTAAGTVLIKDIATGSMDAFSDFGIDGDYLAVIGNVLYFNAANDGNNFELWRSDGTEAGTYLLKDIVPGSSPSRPVLLSNAGGTLYFQVKNAQSENEIWKSDGTESGTVFLKSILYVYEFNTSGDYFVEYNGYVYFAAGDELGNEELYRTDGTTAGTVLFKEINTDDGSELHGLKVINDKLIFFAEDEADDHIYISDGTVNGTVVLIDKDGNPVIASGVLTYDTYLVFTGEKLYFPGGPVGNNKLWVTDGTPAGTYKLINAGHDNSSYGTALGNNAVLKLEDPSGSCYTFYETNGTVAGTYQSFECELLKQHNFLVTLGDKVIFTAASDDEGNELWSYQPSFTTGIDPLATEEITLYPNPSLDGIFHCSIDEAKPVALHIQDILGRSILFNPSFHSQSAIDLSAFPKGIYLIEMQSGAQRWVSKLINE